MEEVFATIAIAVAGIGAIASLVASIVESVRRTTARNTLLTKEGQVEGADGLQEYVSEPDKLDDDNEDGVSDEKREN